MERIVSQIREKGDVAIAISVVFVILIMIIPLNPFLADLFLTVSISLSLLILFIGMYIQRPLDFSVFPSVLLITTLFRLSLNIASTRLILLHGDEGSQAAGRLIKAFGTFIVGGNYIVGTVVFLILIIINFVVITKGAGRVAEVAARFTLDAMPGKQMSIDADLNAGLIDDATARKRQGEHRDRSGLLWGDGRCEQVRAGGRHSRHYHRICEYTRRFCDWCAPKRHAHDRGPERVYHPYHRRGPRQPNTCPPHFDRRRHNCHEGRK